MTIRTAPARPLRVGMAVVGVAGALALAGCAGDAAESSQPGAGSPDAPDTGSGDSSDTGSGDSTGAGSTGSTSAGSYADGTYTAEGSYVTPESIETISVTITLAGDVITAVTVVGDPQKSESAEYQGEFIGGIADVVVGKDIDEIAVSRVAGSSLTSGGFNRAIEAIRAEAAA